MAEKTSALKETDEAPKPEFPIVGIGASAGGLALPITRN